MYSNRRKLAAVTFCTALLMVALSANAAAISVRIDSSHLAASSADSRLTRITIRVAGPGGFLEQQRSNNGHIVWYLPSHAPAGSYRYDVYATAVDGNEQSGTAVVEHDNGRFDIENGIMVAPGNNETAASGVWIPVKHLLVGLVAFLLSSAEAADQVVASSAPTITYEDTDLSSTEVWRTRGLAGFVGCNQTDMSAFNLWDSGQSHSVMNICGSGDSGIAVPNARSLVIDSSGNITLADGAVFVERDPVGDVARLGIGTTTPGTDTHLVGGGTVSLRLESTGSSFSSPRTYELATNATGTLAPDGFSLEDETAGTQPLVVIGGAPNEALVIQANGDVGLLPNTSSTSVATPDSAFHLQRSDGTANILVEETSSAVGARQLYTLENNGPVGFGMVNNDRAEEWRFAAQTTGFRISLAGSGGQEFEVGNDGTLAVGPAGAQNLFLDTNGNATFKGTVTADGTLLTSSRTVKQNIEPVDSAAILAQVTNLPLARWSYEGKTERHLGPMAEDFYGRFGLGPDDEHVSPADMAGVAMASIQALDERLAAKQRKIEKLEAEVDRRTDGLRAKNAQLRARVEKLAGMVGQLATRLEAGDDQLAETLR